MLVLFYLILLFQLYYLINQSYNINIYLILLTQIILCLILYNKELTIFAIKNYKLKLTKNINKYGLLLLLSFIINIICFKIIYNKINLK